MAKEWILNSVMNRFQLSFKRNVGAVSEEIRKCGPKTIDQWQMYYFEHVRGRDHIDGLGRKLYVKISEVIAAEIEQVSEQDCIEYMHNLVINRTFDGYMTEITTVYGQLQKHLNTKIEPATDEWDRLFNVDFFIRVNDAYIGLQIKPVSAVSQIPKIYKERSLQKRPMTRLPKNSAARFFTFSLSNRETPK